MRSKNTGKNDIFFQKLANAYVEKQGEQLADEMRSQDVPPANLLPRIKSRIRADRVRAVATALLGAAAVLVVAVFYSASNRLLGNIAKSADGHAAEDIHWSDNAGGQIQDEKIAFPMEQISAKLPDTYKLAGADYDNGNTIYYIESYMASKVVLTVERTSREPVSDGLQLIELANMNIYVAQRADYSIATFRDGEYLYTLTSPYDCDELIYLGARLV